jgi:hypothetical protein
VTGRTDITRCAGEGVELPKHMIADPYGPAHTQGEPAYSSSKLITDGAGVYRDMKSVTCFPSSHSIAQITVYLVSASILSYCDDDAVYSAV